MVGLPGCLGILLTHVQVILDQDTQIPFSGFAIQSLIPQSLHTATAFFLQVQNPALALLKRHTVCDCPALIVVQMHCTWLGWGAPHLCPQPLCCQPAERHIHCFPQCLPGFTGCLCEKHFLGPVNGKEGVYFIPVPGNVLHNYCAIAETCKIKILLPIVMLSSCQKRVLEL